MLRLGDMGMLTQSLLRKSAFIGRALKSEGLRNALLYGGVPTAAIGFSDIMSHGRTGDWDKYVDGLQNPTPGRIGNTLLNGIIGTLAAKYYRGNKAAAGTKALLSIPAKDVLFGLTGPVEHLPSFMDTVGRSSDAQKLLAASAAASLPLAYMGGRKILENQNSILQRVTEESTRRQRGIVKVALPPARPGFPPTIVELPLEEMNISSSLAGKLGRDVRRKLRDGTDARTYTRNPATHDLIESEPWLGAEGR